MASPLTIQLLASQVRLESGLRSNQVLSDADLYSFINEAYLDLRDRLIVRFASWFRAEKDFSLTSDNNVFDLTTIPDFQMAQGLNLNQDPNKSVTVTMLCSYQERNAFTSTWPFLGNSYGYSGVLGRKYWIDGDRLEVLPAQNASGDYKLIYTPIQTMQAQVVQPVTVTTGDDAFNNSGFISYTLANSSFVPDYIGGSITVTFESPNTAFNGTFTITDTPTASHVVNTSGNWPGGSFTGPAVGTASITYQPIGTTDTLPAKLVPWSQYMVLYAAIAVRNSRNQDPSALLARFADIKQRVIDLTKQRSEGVRQAPISRSRYGGIIGNG